MRAIDANALQAINTQFGLEAINIVRVFWGKVPGIDNTTYIDYCDKGSQIVQQYDAVQARILEISGMDNIVSMDRGSASTSITVKLDDSDGTLLKIINSSDMQKRPVSLIQWFTNAPEAQAFVLFTGEITTPMEWSEGERTLTFTVVSKVENIELGFSLEEGVIEALPVNVWNKPFPIVFGSVYQSPTVMIEDAPYGILETGFVWLNSETVNIPLDSLAGGNPTQSSASLGSRQAGNIQSENATSGGFQSEGNGQGVLGITVYQYEINKLFKQMEKIYQMAQTLYKQSLAAELLAASYNDGDIGVQGNPDNYQTYLNYNNQSIQLYRQVQQYAKSYFEMQAHLANLIADYAQKKAFAYNPVSVYSQFIPQGVPLIIEIGTTRFNAMYNGTSMYLYDQILPPNLPPERVFIAGVEETYTLENSAARQEQKKYLWFDAGSKVRVINLPMYYIACQGTTNDIQAVYGESYGVRVPLPPELYSIKYYNFTNGDGVTVSATVIVINQPLTTLYDNTGNMMYQSDSIWVDVVSSVPGGLVPILLWTISNYTAENVSDIGPIFADETTFNQVNTYTNADNNPMNFTVIERKNVIDFMKEICLQARTAIWIDNGKVKLRYLPNDPGLSPSLTIDASDVIENSLVICTDETELLKTKVVGKWRPNMSQETPNEIVERVNIGFYGVLTETLDMYCYQFADLVQRSIGYWAQRWGNTWKKVKLKTHIGKLQIEGQDAVKLTGFNNLFSDGDCVGIVETCKYDSQNLQLEFEIWLPILWGSMTPYVWAYPQDVTEYWGPNFIQYNTFNPFQGSFDDQGLFQTQRFINYQAPPFGSGPHQLNDQPPDLTFTTALTGQPPAASADPGFFDTNRRPTGLQLANSQNVYKIKNPPPTDDAVPDEFDMGIVLEYVKDVTIPALQNQNNGGTGGVGAGDGGGSINSQLYRVQSLTQVSSDTFAAENGYAQETLGASSGLAGTTSTQGAGANPIPLGINNPVPAGAGGLGANSGQNLKVYNAIQVNIASGWKVVANTIVQLYKKAGTWYMQAPTWAPASTNTAAATTTSAGNSKSSGGGSQPGGGSFGGTGSVGV